MVIPLTENLIRQYEEITEKLEIENKDYDDIFFSRMLARIVEDDSSTDEEEDIFEEMQRKHNFFQLTFRCLRIYICCQLITYGSTEYEKDLKEDIEEVIEIMQKIEYAWKISDELLQDTMDILDLLCIQYNSMIVRNFLNNTSFRKAGREEISPTLFYIAMGMVGYLKENQFFEYAAQLIEQLCFMSCERNSLDNHIEVLLRSIPEILDDVPEVVYRICLSNHQFFVNNESAESSDFYWFFSLASYESEHREEANAYLKKCINLRKEIFGEMSWYTVVAEFEFVIRTMSSTKDEDVRNYLFRFVDDIEARVYKDIDLDYAIVMEGKALYLLLCNDPDIESIEQYEYYVDLYENLCKKNSKYPSPLLTLRMARNIRGAVFLRLGNYIEAEKSFIDALEIDSESDLSSIIISDAQIKSNLLMAYFVQSDFEKAYPLLIELLELIDSEQECGLSDSDEYRIYTIWVSLDSYFDVSEEYDLLEIVREECEDIIINEECLSENDKEQVTFLITAISVLLQKDIDKEEFKKLYNALTVIERHISDLRMERRREMALYYLILLLSYRFSLPNIKYYMQKALGELYQAGVPVNIRIAVLQIAAIYNADHNKELVKNYLESACNELTGIWQQNIKYLNDSRLIKCLLNAQIQYNLVYSVQRQLLEKEECYNSLLNFKLLASLSGRERNKIINSGILDNDLMDKIQNQQNYIASLEADTVGFVEEKRLDEANEKMRQLEAEFAVYFPKVTSFTEISLERVKSAMQDNTVVIEYFDTVPRYDIKDLVTISDEEKRCIDVYVLKKINGQCSLYKQVIEKGETVLKGAEKFIGIYQDLTGKGVTTKQIEELEQLRYLLYKELIKPVKKYFEGIGTIFVAPSNELMNVPFGLLNDEMSERLQEEYKIIKIECARDFLFSNDNLMSDGKTLILGDPEYNIRERIREEVLKRTDEQRSIEFKDNIIKPLPFSRIEAIRISQQLYADCYIGINASKNNLLTFGEYKGVHLATHGWVDYGDSEEALYSSCIFLAGAQNWLSDHVQDPQIGNGVVTADEISRQNWKKVKLVVLSTCMSGLNNYTINKGFHGMISALSAAGVKYVISSLWSQDDLGTAVMMEEFYRLYEGESRTPDEALCRAKEYLKNISIRDLKEKGWLGIQDDRVQPVLEQYRQMNDRVKPFRNEIYWGGFECFQCN